MTESVEQHFFETVPSARDRVLIDMVNSMDVARDHLIVARIEEDDVLGRLFGAISGKTQRRNNRIAQAQQVSLDALMQTVTDLARRDAKAFAAIRQVAMRLTEVEKKLAMVARATVEVREAVGHLRGMVDEYVRRIQNDINRLDLRIAATEQMDYVLSRWSNGRFNLFPVASRGFIVLHELYWGQFGEYLRHQARLGNTPILLYTLKEKMASHWRQQIGEDEWPLVDWLAHPPLVEQSDTFFVEGLAYLGRDRCSQRQPWSYTLTQLPDMREVPASIVRLLDPDRLSDRLVSEMFAVNA